MSVFLLSAGLHECCFKWKEVDSFSQQAGVAHFAALTAKLSGSQESRQQFLLRQSRFDAFVFNVVNDTLMWDSNDMSL